MAPCEWVIDIIKEWVTNQAYATIVYVDSEITALKAWVEAKLYLQKAEYPGYGMPIHVTGDLNPDVTCTYFRCGDYNGKPCYSQEDGSYFIWWGVADWFIGTVIGGGPLQRLWRRNDPSVFGDYTPRPGSTGLATVTSGYKYLLTGFVNRGDPAAVDFDEDDLVLDNAWHDLDLSGIAPAGAKAVSLFAVAVCTEISKIVTFKTKGNANDFNISRLFATVALGVEMDDLTVPLDANRKIQYKTSVATWILINITVKGWWL